MIFKQLAMVAILFFQTISYCGHLVFQNEAKILHRQVFIAINIPCEFGEDFFYK